MEILPMEITLERTTSLYSGISRGFMHLQVKCRYYAINYIGLDCKDDLKLK